jgi:hypothetical protein
VREATSREKICKILPKKPKNFFPKLFLKNREKREEILFYGILGVLKIERKEIYGKKEIFPQKSSWIDLCRKNDLLFFDSAGAGLLVSL